MGGCAQLEMVRILLLRERLESLGSQKTKMVWVDSEFRKKTKLYLAILHSATSNYHYDPSAFHTIKSFLRLTQNTFFTIWARNSNSKFIHKKTTMFYIFLPFGHENNLYFSRVGQEFDFYGTETKLPEYHFFEKK